MCSVFFRPMFSTYLLKQLESACVDFSLKYSLLQCTVWFVSMVAVIKTALSKIGAELDKPLLNLAKTQMMQTKHLHTGAVYQFAVMIHMVEACMSGGMFA